MLRVPEQDHDLMSIEQSMIRNQALAFSDGSSDGSVSNYQIHQKLVNMARHLSNETTSTPTIPINTDQMELKSTECLRTPTKQSKLLKEVKFRSSGKTLSAEKEGTEFSLSSDPVDLREENENLRERLQEVTSQLQHMIDMEKEAKFQALFYKKKMQAAEEKVTALNKRISELQVNLQQKQDSIGQIKLELIAKKDQQDLFQGQIEGLREDFERAKAIGQTQIDSLLVELRQKNLELSQVQSLNQSEFMAHAGLSRTEPGLSPVKQSPVKTLPTTAKSFLNRFYSFSKQIDRKIQCLNLKSSSQDPVVNLIPVSSTVSPSRSDRHSQGSCLKADDPIHMSVQKGASAM